MHRERLVWFAKHRRKVTLDEQFKEELHRPGRGVGKMRAVKLARPLTSARNPAVKAPSSARKRGLGRFVVPRER